MIRSLYIENFVLLKSERLFFSPGLNVITGESGAGKTIILEALTFLLGISQGKNFLPPGCTESHVEAFFEFSGEKLNYLQSLPFSRELNGEIIISRTYHSGGRSEYYLDHRQITLDFLRQIRSCFVEACFREEAFSAYEPDSLLTLIDSRLSAEDRLLRILVVKLYQEFLTMKREHDEFTRSRGELERKRDFQRFQLSEIEESGLLAWNQEELEREYEFLANFEEVTTVFKELSDYFQDASLTARIGEKLKSLNRIRNLPERASALVALLESIASSCSEYSSASEGFLSSVAYDGERLSSLSALMDRFSEFQKKYGLSIREIAEHAENLRKELSILDERLNESQNNQRLKEAEEEYLIKAQTLSRARKKQAEGLGKSILKNLKGLSLDQSKLSFLWKEKEPAADGIDQTQLFFSANPGMPPQPLQKVASFGENSRLLLALKLSLISPYSSTLAFDEIEAGLGGKTLTKTVEKLCELSKSYQVIAVTHSRRLAEAATQHFAVQKETKGEETILRVRQLSEGEPRNRELERLLK
ncbi:MAG: AAA family ATPase [Candidatus Wallbacteria bacterium]|nr:AAA family ATPase [Candidatus Wallbacteria bacterium]